MANFTKKFAHNTYKAICTFLAASLSSHWQEIQAIADSEIFDLEIHSRLKTDKSHTLEIARNSLHTKFGWPEAI